MGLGRDKLLRGSSSLLKVLFCVISCFLSQGHTPGLHGPCTFVQIQWCATFLHTKLLNEYLLLKVTSVGGKVGGPLCVVAGVSVFSRLPKKHTKFRQKPHRVSLSHYCQFSAISLSSVWEAFLIIQTRFWWYDFVGAEQAIAELCRFGEDSASAQCSFCVLSVGQSHILSGRCVFALLRHILPSTLFASEKKYNTNFTVPYWTKANKLKCSNEHSAFCKWISNRFKLSTWEIWDRVLSSPWPYLWLSCD